MTVNNSHIDNDKTQELISLLESCPDKYKNLQVFLHRERDNDSRPDNYFLMVSPRVFGKVEVLDLTVEGKYIILEFFDCTMQEVGNIRLKIDDDKPQVLFICWQDIRKMVLNESLTISNDGLLEFDF
ncbi:MAG: hypothetical protein LC649_02290 [Bacteroidales bacterium]|nr:hypothetical protein [Bacteroidales bacterium]